MTTDTLQYKLLQLVPYPHREEAINIGVLGWHQAKGFRFIGTNNTAPIKKLFSEVNLQDIKAYLKSFEHQAGMLGKNHSWADDDADSAVQRYFLANNGSSFQFSEWKFAPVLENFQVSLDHLGHTFLSGFSTQTVIDKGSKGDKAALKPLLEKLKSVKGKEWRSIIKPGAYPLKYRQYTFRSDYYWRADKIHLIKGLDFTLESEEAIIDKALLNSKRLEYLEGELEKNNLHVDLIVQFSKSPVLQQASNDALKILQETEGLARIISPSGYNAYTAMVLETAEPIAA